MLNQRQHNNNFSIRRFFLWSLVATYTLALPNAIFVYNTITKHFSVAIARKVPIALILLMGIVYIVSALAVKKDIKSAAMLVPGIIIVLIFVSLERNPNKHIHIPEYVVMAWLLFEVISLDYRGRGLFGLVFVCAALLGIVDEIAQGILPDRHYGWKDMIINSASVLIGIFTLAGLRTLPAGDWAWIPYLKRLKIRLGVIFFGTAGAILTCIYLFDVQAQRTLQGVYPGWLLVWNGLFLLVGPVVIFRPVFLFEPLPPEEGMAANPADYSAAASLWTICPLVIFIVLHSLVVVTAFTGLGFN